MRKYKGNWLAAILTNSSVQTTQGCMVFLWKKLRSRGGRDARMVWNWGRAHAYYEQASIRGPAPLDRVLQWDYQEETGHMGHFIPLSVPSSQFTSQEVETRRQKKGTSLCADLTSLSYCEAFVLKKWFSTFGSRPLWVSRIRYSAYQILILWIITLAIGYHPGISATISPLWIYYCAV